MKRCQKDKLEFPDDRRFCSACGAALIEEFESATLLMPKMNTKKAKFIEMNDDGTFKLFIHDNDYQLSMAEVKTLAAEIHETVGVANLCLAAPKD